jgi:hypothetical protein
MPFSNGDIFIVLEEWADEEEGWDDVWGWDFCWGEDVGWDFWEMNA